MTDIMKLADVYADRLHIDRKYHNEESSYDRDAARAALQSAIEALQANLEAANQLIIGQLIETSQKLGLYDK